MKKAINIFYAVVVLFIITASQAHAKDNSGQDYFIGKWKVKVYGIPQGDTELIIIFENSNEEITGKILSSGDDQQDIPLTEIKMDDKSVSAHYLAMGYEVFFTLEKDDDDAVTGYMMDMFEMKGSRLKE